MADLLCKTKTAPSPALLPSRPGHSLGETSEAEAFQLWITREGLKGFGVWGLGFGV